MMQKRLMQVLFLCALTSFLSGCNTFRGFGEDVSHLGNAISRVASCSVNFVNLLTVRPSAL